MDAFDSFIVNLHLILGHDKTADFIGAPRGDRRECRLCLGHDPHEIFDGTVRWDGNTVDAATWEAGVADA